MTLPLDETTHTDDETLAAYIDDRLTPEARAAAEHHLTTCDDCYAVYALSAEFVEEEKDTTSGTVADAAASRPASSRARFTRRGRAIAILAAAAALTVILWSPAHEWYLQRTAGVPTLVSAANELPYRLLDARPAGGFAHRKRANTLRTGLDVGADPELMAVHAVAADIVAKRSGSAVGDLHTRGVSLLVLGEHDAAAATLRSAVQKATSQSDLNRAINASTDATLLNDVASAFYTRGNQRDDGRDLNVAWKAAERGWLLAKTPELAWNRALTREALHRRSEAEALNGRSESEALNLRREAVAAWRDYLVLDATSGWADDARRHLSDLDAPAQATPATTP